ncbi:unnamed protein product, partial [Cylindrotheca closterium]
MSWVLQVCLPKAGVCRNFPWDVVFAPLSYQGLGLPHPFGCQVFKHLEMLLRHMANRTKTGDYMEANIQAHQLETGTSFGLLQQVYTNTAILASDTWLKRVWHELKGLDIYVAYDSPALSLRCTDDSLLMDLFINLEVEQEELLWLNWCRMFLQGSSTMSRRYAPAPSHPSCPWWTAPLPSDALRATVRSITGSDRVLLTGTGRASEPSSSSSPSILHAWQTAAKLCTDYYGWVPDEIEVHGDEAILADALLDGRLRVISDGSFKNELGTAAVQLLDQSPYRSELIGLLAGIMAVDWLLEQWSPNILTGPKVRIACDGLSAIKMAFEDRQLSPTDAQFDLVSSIREAILLSSVDWAPQHVYGHLDKSNLFDKLSWWEKRNLEVDGMAVEYRKELETANHLIAPNPRFFTKLAWRHYGHRSGSYSSSRRFHMRPASHRTAGIKRPMAALDVADALSPSEEFVILGVGLEHQSPQPVPQPSLFTAWEAASAEVDEYFGWTPEELEIVGDEGRLVETLLSGHLCVISDGSYKRALGTVAVQLLPRKGEKDRIIVWCQTPGLPQDQSAYRSELIGLLAGIMVVDWLLHQWAPTLQSKPRIRIACDGFSALLNTFSANRVTPQQAQFDLVSSLREALAHSKASWEPSHVYGHLDHATPFLSLSWWSKRNVEVDNWAVAYRHQLEASNQLIAPNARFFTE